MEDGLDGALAWGGGAKLGFSQGAVFTQSVKEGKGFRALKVCRDLKLGVGNVHPVSSEASLDRCRICQQRRQEEREKEMSHFPPRYHSFGCPRQVTGLVHVDVAAAIG
jgi:hypothetical protein